MTALAAEQTNRVYLSGPKIHKWAIAKRSHEINHKYHCQQQDR